MHLHDFHVALVSLTNRNSISKLSIGHNGHKNMNISMVYALASHIVCDSHTQKIPMQDYERYQNGKKLPTC